MGRLTSGGPFELDIHPRLPSRFAACRSARSGSAVEKNGIAIATNEAFTGWSKTFTGPRLCAAIVDRLAFNATLIETGTESYRLARTNR